MRDAYYGFPGGRPVWHFPRASKQKPNSVQLPTGRHDMLILRLVADGEDTHVAIARGIGVKTSQAASTILSALDRGGYVARTPSRGCHVRIVSLTSKGRAALALASKAA